MKHHLLSALIIGIAALVITVPVAAKLKFTSNETKAQAEAGFEKQEVRSEAITPDKTEKTAKQRAQILRHEKATAMEQQALFDKVRSKDSPLLHAWLGADEPTLLESWGTPANIYNTQDARFLTFTHRYGTEMVDDFENVPEGSRQKLYCSITFELRAGIAKDYRSGGNYCGKL
jgi:hypothetical protein